MSSSSSSSSSSRGGPRSTPQAVSASSRTRGAGLRAQIGRAKATFSTWLRGSLGVASGGRRNAINRGSGGMSTTTLMDRFIPVSSSPQFLNSIENARNNWNPTAGATNNFHNLMRDGLTSGGRQQFQIRRDANPSALALALLDYRLSNEMTMTADQRARRFVMVINGVDNNGQQREMARSIDPGNVRQVLSLVSAIAGGRANRLANEDPNLPQMPLEFGSGEAGMSSDPEAYEFSFMSEITSITLRAINPVETVNADGDVISQLPSSPTSYQGGDPNPAPQLRRSARVAARGSSGGAFFRYWLSETFPESLSFLQVYKKSETKRLVKNLSVKGDWVGDGVNTSFELSCLANSFIMQELPSSKFMTLFEHTCSNANPVFPTSRMKALAIALGVNICLSIYSPTKKTCGKREVHFRGAAPLLDGEEEKVYYIGKVGEHFVPDIESDWTRYAIRHFKKLKDRGGRPYRDLPLYRVKQLKMILTLNRAPFVQFIIRGSGPYATYGEILSILLWGHTEMDNGSVYHQPPFVETMEVEDICLRAELYMYFQSKMKFYDLPTAGASMLDLQELVAHNSRPIKKYQFAVLSFSPNTIDPDRWGPRKMFPGKRIEFEMFREQYLREGGATLQKEWMFPDRHMFKTVHHIPASSSKKEDEFVPYCIVLPYTMVAFDTETLCMSASQAKDLLRKFYANHSYPENNDFVNNSDGVSPSIAPSLIDSMYNDEGICDWEDACDDEEEENSIVVDDDDIDNGGESKIVIDVDAEKENQPKNVHVPYCASVCYYVDAITNLPINFRLYGVEDFGVGSGKKFVLRKRTFYGFDCMLKMNMFFGCSLFNDVSIHLIAHNARYDVNMMMRYSFAIIEDGIFQSTGRMNVCDLSIQAFPHSQADVIIDGVLVEKKMNERSLGVKVYHRSNVWSYKRKLRVQCSLACTGIPLSAFGATFDMNISKEYMPYDIYSYDRLFKDNLRVGGYPKRKSRASIETQEAWTHTSAPSKEEFEKSVRSANAMAPPSPSPNLLSSSMLLWDYASYYCEMDCEVLLVGFLSLRREMHDLKMIGENGESTSEMENQPPCGLMLENAVSLPQFASHYFGLNKVFEGIHEYKGLVMSFLRRGVCGGKTMLAANSPVIYDVSNPGGEEAGEVDDMDAVNLYGSAMYNIAKDHGGFPTGTAKIWVPQGGEGAFSTFLPSYVADSQYYMALISIKKLGRPLRFPIVNGPREIFPHDGMDQFLSHLGFGVEGRNGKGETSSKVDPTAGYFDSAEVLFEKLTRSSNSSSRHFTNHPEGARMVVDKITLEDILNFHHGAEFEVYQAVYWDEGGNPRIGGVMEYLFADRVKKQEEGKKAAAQARKLVMNSGYGRFLMAAPDSDYHFVEGRDNIHRYVARHSCTTKESTFIRKDFAVVERRKGVQNFYNATPLGAMVLSASKRIMNRVMCLYEDLFAAHKLGKKFCMFYQDTDSIHLARNHIEPLFRAYTKKYGEKILVRKGEPETEYTISSKRLGAFCSDFEPVSGFTPPVSEVFIGVMKKVYVDCMRCHSLDADRTMKELYHARMKGIPKNCVTITAELEKMNLYQMYKMIFMGFPLTFDLAKHSIRFDMGKDFSVTTNTSFKRVVQLNWESIILAQIEWVKSGWSAESFPYYDSFMKLGESKKVWVYAPVLGAFNWEYIRKEGGRNFFLPPPRDVDSISVVSSTSMRRKDVEVAVAKNSFIGGSEGSTVDALSSSRLSLYLQYSQQQQPQQPQQPTDTIIVNHDGGGGSDPNYNLDLYRTNHGSSSSSCSSSSMSSSGISFGSHTINDGYDPVPMGLTGYDTDETTIPLDPPSMYGCGGDDGMLSGENRGYDEELSRHPLSFGSFIDGGEGETGDIDFANFNFSLSSSPNVPGNINNNDNDVVGSSPSLFIPLPDNLSPSHYPSDPYSIHYRDLSPIQRREPSPPPFDWDWRVDM